MNEKAQITLFLIIGILAMLMIGLIIYSATTILFLPQQRLTDIKPINEYITNCIDQTTVQALELLGKQGGYIYESQGGLVKDFESGDKGKFFLVSQDTCGNANCEVPYGITKREKNFSQYRANPSDYPWVGFPGSPPDYKGLFGDSKLTPLHKKTGTFSIQKEIETYVTKKLKECTDFSIFKDYQVIEVGNITTEVSITKNDLLISVDYPLQVKTASQTRNLKEFSLKKGIRLKQIYDFVKYIIDQDNTNITFDILAPTSRPYGISVEKILGVSGTIGDDLIIIKDDKSLLKNKPYEFWFSRRNRPPALDAANGLCFDPDEDIIRPAICTSVDCNGKTMCYDNEFKDWEE